MLAGFPDDCGYRRRGGFLLASERTEGALLAESEDMLREDGFPGEFLDHYMLETRFALAGFAGAYWAQDDAELDAGRLADALREAAVERGAALAELGTVGHIATTPGGIEVDGDEGRVRAQQAVLAQDALVHLVGVAVTTVRGERVEADVQPGAPLPSPARTADGRFAWQMRGSDLRLARPRGQAASRWIRVLGRLPVARPVRRETAVVAPEDRLPLVGPVIPRTS